MKPCLGPKRLEQLARFCAIGFVCYAVGLGVLAALTEFAGVHYLASYVVAYLLAGATGYVLNGRYTFAARQLAPAGYARYVFVNSIVLALNGVLLWVLVDLLHTWYVPATLVLAVLGIPVSFLAHRGFSYGTGRARIHRSA
jgi:putative flippase GtrA